jgi:hypothetical protein
MKRLFALPSGAVLVVLSAMRAQREWRLYALGSRRDAPMD